ncbi:MAG: DUF6293 family protein [Candidatus Thorarchaeota archaeon]|nr:DUF6293 family protein [Candidatus Thorarchaeota archaeon]
MGFHRTQRVDYVIRHFGGNKLVLLHSEDTKDNAEAVKEEIEKAFTVELRPVDPWDYYDVLATALEIVLEHQGWEIRFNPSLGTRVMTAALVMAAAYINAKLYLVIEIQGEEKGVREIEPIKREKLQTPKRKILEKLIEAGGCVESQKDLGSRMELGASSISRHVNMLRDWGYITKDPRTGSEKKGICITKLGRVVLGLSKHWKENDS